MASVKCRCAGKKHVFVATSSKPVCGCIGPGFIQSAKRNHYCAVVHAAKDPEEYRETMLTVPLKGKLTVSTRSSKLDSHIAKVETFEFRDARIEDRESSIENRDIWNIHKF